MSWDPSVLRKYNTTGHFRLLNQVRSELKANPLVRPKEGERIGEVNRSKALVRAIAAKQGSQSRGRRQAGRETGGLVVVETMSADAQAQTGLYEPSAWSAAVDAGTDIND
jgi:hypothetical protein